MRTLVYGNIFELFDPFVDMCSFESFVMKNPVTDERIIQNPFEYILEMDIDGLAKKDLQLKVDNGNLIISGFHKKYLKAMFKRETDQTERSFTKQFTLSDDMNTDAIKAKFRNGTLTIIIPKKAEYVNYREIPVNGNEHFVEAEIADETGAGFINKVKTKLKSVFNKRSK